MFAKLIYETFCIGRTQKTEVANIHRADPRPPFQCHTMRRRSTQMWNWCNKLNWEGTRKEHVPGKSPDLITGILKFVRKYGKNVDFWEGPRYGTEAVEDLV